MGWFWGTKPDKGNDPGHGAVPRGEAHGARGDAAAAGSQAPCDIQQGVEAIVQENDDAPGASAVLLPEADAEPAAPLPTAKTGVFGRLLGGGAKKKSSAPAPAEGADQDERGEENAQTRLQKSEEDTLVEEELALIDPAACQRRPEDQDPLSLMSNDVLGVVEAIHTEHVVHEGSESGSSRGGLNRRADEKKVDKQDINWEEFQVHAAHLREVDLQKLGVVARCFDDFERCFRWVRSRQKKWCSVCNPLFSRLELWIFSSPSVQRNIPEYPHKNWCGFTLDNTLRKILMRLTSDTRLEIFWLLNNLSDVALLLVANETGFVFPFWCQFVPPSIYLLELLIKGSACGLYGAQKAFLTSSFLNKIQFIVTVGSIAEVILKNMLEGSIRFTLRGFGLFRIFHWLMKVDMFAAINMFLYTVDNGSLPLMTVIFVVVLCLVFFGVIGMASFRRSFQRRCVWADTLELKVPEQLCKRFRGIGTCLNSPFCVFPCLSLSSFILYPITNVASLAPYFRRAVL